MATPVIWGRDDPIIPVEHGRYAHALVPDSRLVELAGAGHFPMLDDPDRIADELAAFVEETEPYVWDIDSMRQSLRAGPAGTRQLD